MEKRNKNGVPDRDAIGPYYIIFADGAMAGLQTENRNVGTLRPTHLINLQTKIELQAVGI